jgi:hypothetical protein
MVIFWAELQRRSMSGGLWTNFGGIDRRYKITLPFPDPA